MRHRFVDHQLPIRPTGSERLVDVDLAGRLSVFAREKFVRDRALVRDEEREMIRRGFARGRHRRRATGRRHFICTMRIFRFRCGRWNAFAANGHKHGRIIWLIADRIWFAVLNPEVRPVVVDLEC